MGKLLYLCTINNNKTFKIMEADEKIINKIKNLMLKQESAMQIGSIHEAEAFAAKAQQLLLKYNLDKGRIDFSQPDSVGEQTMVVMFPTIGGQSAFDIMFPIAKYNGCRLYFFGNKKDNKMKIFGTPDNIDVCQYIFKLVSQALIAICKTDYANYKKNYVPTWDSEKGKESKIIGYDTYARSFMRGAGKGLGIKLKSEIETFKANNSTANGLMVINDNAVAEFALKKYNIGSVKSSPINSESDAFYKGKQAGTNVQYAKGLSGEMNAPVPSKNLTQ